MIGFLRTRILLPAYFMLLLIRIRRQTANCNCLCSHKSSQLKGLVCEREHERDAPAGLV